jgi:GT2 family glycosyltransferase
LNSLQAFSGKAEVIIVDDGSKFDSTRNLLDEACSRNHWRLIKNSIAIGHSRASEAGVAVSSRPIVCLLNSDTVVTHRSWFGIIKAFDHSDQIVVVGPSTSLTPTPQRVKRAEHCRHYWTDSQILAFAASYCGKHENAPIIDIPYAGGFAFFVRRSTWEIFRGFDRQLPDYGNEKEFCLRILQSGLRVVWTKQSYIHHLGSESYEKTIGRLAIIERSNLANV